MSAAEHRLMPPEHGRRVAELLPQGHLVQIADSYTLAPEDQPATLTSRIREFFAERQPLPDAAEARRQASDTMKTRELGSWHT
jgi:hypothetical protein